MNPGVVAFVAILGVGLCGGIYYVTRAAKPATTIVAQAPTPAVAGIQALSTLAAGGFDAWLKYKIRQQELDLKE